MHDLNKRFDLNLLTVFDALMRERHAGRAAERLNLTQPAVSHALGRLRELVGDPLFVRHARGMRPTPGAQTLGTVIVPALATLRGSLRAQRGFDPGAVARTVVIGSSDYIDLVLIPHLAAQLQRDAPRLDLRFRATASGAVADQLRRGEIDMAIGPLAAAPRHGELTPLFTERFVAVARARHPAFAKRPTPKRFAELPQLLISPQGDAAGPVDRALAERGLARRVAMTVTHFAAAPFVIEACDLVAVMPERVAHRMLPAARIAIHPLPLAIPHWTVGLVTSASHGADPLMDWLAALIRKVAKERLSKPRKLR